MSSPDGYTVDEMIALLTDLSQKGHGSDRLVLPYNPGHTSIGASPVLKITNLSAGIDWDNNRVFLHPDQPVSVLDTELVAKAQKSQSQLAQILFLAQRLGSERNTQPLDEQIALFKSQVEAVHQPVKGRKLTP